MRLREELENNNYYYRMKTNTHTVGTEPEEAHKPQTAGRADQPLLGCGAAPPGSPGTPLVPAAPSPRCPPTMPARQFPQLHSAHPDPSRLCTTTRGSFQQRWHFIRGRTEGQTGPNTGTETPTAQAPQQPHGSCPPATPRVEQGIPAGFPPLTSLFCGLSGRLMPFILW